MTSESTMDTAVWVYAVCAEDLPPSTEERLTGVDGEDVRMVTTGAVTAVVGSVRLDRFGEETLRRRLNDLDQLEEIARAHHRIIEFVGHAQPVLPARLATVYADDSGVVAMLERGRESLESALASVTGREEWGVKIYRRSDPSADSPSSSESAPISGREYLRLRKAAVTAKQATIESAMRAAEEAHRMLATVAVDVRQHRPQHKQLSGDPRPMVLNGAYLVEQERAADFIRTVDELASQYPQLALTLTGPWPPYSFQAGDAVIQHITQEPA